MQNDRITPELAQFLQARAEVRAEARGWAKSVLKVLEVRGVPVPELRRLRILECNNLAVLEFWLVRSLKATTVEELFDYSDWRRS
ncbi:hypothetical protein ACFLIM_26390 [Nonomuraea sp. M3C6]|uniref:Uncharacterized protein n=1 Tax=Nonomuraea marmarensis TaxID=3351344 RepID=A0ABW7AI70_9ACTN